MSIEKRGVNRMKLCDQTFTPAVGMTAEKLARGILAVYADLQLYKNLPCPRCGQHTMSEDVMRNALSRREPPSIFVCDQCGVIESIEAYTGNEIPLTSWQAVKDVLSDNPKGFAGVSGQ
jgi:predicted RNA-binding Zn-ribbon protein involved in translation (DUF1610 family)